VARPRSSPRRARWAIATLISPECTATGTSRAPTAASPIAPGPHWMVAPAGTRAAMAAPIARSIASERIAGASGAAEAAPTMRAGRLMSGASGTSGREGSASMTTSPANRAARTA